MKILMPVEVFYPSQAGGAASSVYFVTKYLDADRFESVVITTDKGLQPDVPRHRWILKGNSRVLYVKTRSPIFPIRAVLNSLREMQQKDVIHVPSFFFPTAFISVLAACVLKKKL